MAAHRVQRWSGVVERRQRRLGHFSPDLLRLRLGQDPDCAGHQRTQGEGDPTRDSGARIEPEHCGAYRDGEQGDENLVVVGHRQGPPKGQVDASASTAARHVVARHLPGVVEVRDHLAREWSDERRARPASPRWSARIASGELARLGAIVGPLEAVLAVSANVESLVERLSSSTVTMIPSIVRSRRKSSWRCSQAGREHRLS